MNKDQAIERLKKALNDILADDKLGPQNDFSDIVCNVREIAREALKDTALIEDKPLPPPPWQWG
jgi:hypothetical protein